MKRRALLFSLAATACSGDWAPSGQPPAPTPAPPPPAPAPVPPPAAAWSIPAISIAPGQTFDLTPTLPLGIRRGGVFSVSTTGNPLPAGMMLRTTGVLSGTIVGSTAGVIFQYEEP